MEKPLTQNIRPDRAPLDIVEYERVGGYQALRQALQMPPVQIQQMVLDANLRGRGGAGFPAGTKWGAMPRGDKARRPTFFVVNADEMEPGTFKDRLLMEGDPNLVVESVIIASYAIEADVAYIFLRWAHQLSARRLTKAIAQAYDRGYLGKNILGSPYRLQMSLHTSAGRGFYLAFMVLLWDLIGRGLALETRAHLGPPVGRRACDILFSVASLLIAFTLGTAVGNVVRGVPLDERGLLFLPFWTNLSLRGPRVDCRRAVSQPAAGQARSEVQSDDLQRLGGPVWAGGGPGLVCCRIGPDRHRLGRHSPPLRRKGPTGERGIVTLAG